MRNEEERLGVVGHPGIFPKRGLMCWVCSSADGPAIRVAYACVANDIVCGGLSALRNTYHRYGGGIKRP